MAAAAARLRRPCCHAYCCIRDEQPRINATTKLYGYHEGYKIAAEEFKAVRTVGNVVEAVYQVVNADSAAS